MNGIPIKCAAGRKVIGTPGNSDENIDWSWLQDVARDITLERRAHASGNCCTGTVVLEVPRVAEASCSSSAPAMDEEPKDEPSKSSWLRSSMRRLRHLPLPNGDAVPTGGELTEVTLGRPVSAPSRISANVRHSSRSRSRESGQSAVSLEPSGRARSSSASSRSRRLRSLSSSETSIPSTVDSAVSSPVASTQPTQNPGAQNASPRR